MRPFRHCLYFICDCKFYARKHGKVTRQWKSTLTLMTIVSALTPIIKKYYFFKHHKVSDVVLKDGIINNTFQEERDLAFTSDFCDNHSHHVSPASLYLTSPRPRPTRPRVPYLMSSSPSSCVPKSQVPTHASLCPRPLVPVPLLYTASKKDLHVMRF